MLSNTLKTLLLSGFLFIGCDGLLYDLTVDNTKLATPVLYETFSIEKSNTYTYPFSVHYSGKHFVNLFLNTIEGLRDAETFFKEKKVPNPYAPVQLKGIVSIIDEDNRILATKPFSWNFQYGFLGKTILMFTAPEDIPKNEKLYCKIEFTEVSKNYYERYTSVTLKIRRIGRFF